MPEPEIWIAGGTGRTGRGIAAELVRRGRAPVLIGRDPARLAAAATRTGGATTTLISSGITETADKIHTRRPAVVINTVGPFTETAPALIEACLAGGSDYLDLANDLAGFAEVLGRHEAATTAGRSVVTGAGFGATATESVVVRLCEQRPAPARVRVDMIPSVAMEAGPLGDALAGTLVEGLPGVAGGGRYESRRYQGGRLVPARLAADPVRLTLPGGDQVTTAGMPLGELIAAQRASGAPDVISTSGEAPTAGPIRLVLPYAIRLLSIPAVRRFARRRLAAVRGAARPAPRTHSWGHAVLEYPDGDRREGWLRVGEAMSFTTAVAAEVAQRLVAGEGKPGAYTTAALFGSSLAEACGGEYVLDHTG